jgi:hypothetical protein
MKVNCRRGGRVRNGPMIFAIWVVRKLRELLPRVRDNSLHADLSEMLRSHEANIALATEVSRAA